MRLFYALALVLAAGCALDDEITDEADLEETEQAVNSTNLNSFTCKSSMHAGGPCEFDLGTADNRACFIGGITGPLSHGLGSAVWVGVDPSTNHNTLVMYPPNGNLPISVATVCVSPGAHRTSAHWNPNYNVPAIKIPNTTAATQCFLSSVRVEDTGLTHYNDSLQTWKDANGAWWIGGGMQSGFLDGDATCFDATNIGEWAWFGPAASGNLSSNVNGGVACGLTEIGGVFVTVGHGVYVDYQARAKQWTWTISANAHGAAKCIL